MLMSKSTVRDYVLCSHWLHSNVNVGTNNLKMKSEHEQTRMSMSKNTVHDYEGCSHWLHSNVNVGTNNLKMKSGYEPTQMSMSKNTVHDYEGCSPWHLLNNKRRNSMSISFENDSPGLHLKKKHSHGLWGRWYVGTIACTIGCACQAS